MVPSPSPTRIAGVSAGVTADERVRVVLLVAFVLGLGVSITLSETALALLAVRLGYRLATGRTRTRGWPLGGVFLAWVATSVLAVALSARPLESLSAARGLLLVAAFYVVLDALADEAAAERFLTGLFALLAGVAVVGILQVALCPHVTALAPVLGRVAMRCARAHAFYSIYMTLAGVLSVVALATLPRLLPPAGTSLGWRLPAWVAIVAGLGLTYVRGAWVGFGVGIGVLLVFLRRGRVLVLGGIVVLALALLLVPGVRRRAESIADPNDPTAHERWQMWASGLAMARDHPLTGIGPGQVKHEYARYAAPDVRHRSRSHLHDTPIQILVERGILGLAAWVMIFATFFWRAGRILAGLPPDAARPRALVAGAIAAIAGFLVGGLTEYNFGDSEVALVAYVVMALPFVVASTRGAAGSPSGRGRSSP